MTITEFLLARIGDDEAVANSVTWGHPLGAPPLLMTYGTLHINPERVRAECEAKRRIVENCEAARRSADAAPLPERIRANDGPVAAYWRGQDWACRILASVYESHPDYDEAWRP